MLPLRSPQGVLLTSSATLAPPTPASQAFGSPPPGSNMAASHSKWLHSFLSLALGEDRLRCLAVTFLGHERLAGCRRRQPSLHLSGAQALMCSCAQGQPPSGPATSDCSDQGIGPRWWPQRDLITVTSQVPPRPHLVGLGVYRSKWRCEWREQLSLGGWAHMRQILRSHAWPCSTMVAVDQGREQVEWYSWRQWPEGQHLLLTSRKAVTGFLHLQRRVSPVRQVEGAPKAPACGDWGHTSHPDPTLGFSKGKGDNSCLQKPCLCSLPQPPPSCQRRGCYGHRMAVFIWALPWGSVLLHNQASEAQSRFLRPRSLFRGPGDSPAKLRAAPPRRPGHACAARAETSVPPHSQRVSQCPRLPIRCFWPSPSQVPALSSRRLRLWGKSFSRRPSTLAGVFSVAGKGWMGLLEMEKQPLLDWVECWEDHHLWVSSLPRQPSAAGCVQDSVGACHGCSGRGTMAECSLPPLPLPFLPSFRPQDSCCPGGWPSAMTEGTSSLPRRSPGHLWNECMFDFGFSWFPQACRQPLGFPHRTAQLRLLLEP